MRSEGEKVLEGIELQDEYVNMYANSHKIKDVKYKISYSYYYILDSIMDKEYSLLDIGIGTGGALQEMQKLKRLVGVDGSKKMLEMAEILLKDSKFEKKFIHSLYNEKFLINEKFDAIHLGVYGSYLPFNKSILNHTFRFLNKNGILVCSLSVPDTLYKKIGVIVKMVLNKIPITQYEYVFEKIFLPRNSEILMKVFRYPQAINNAEKKIVYFIRKLV